ncbi:MAG TPA: hypothetical protein VMA74_11435 [Dyella sp.]|uniref:hypothetical protein n=1 Tax=Dyella sp. TaxID=1869338 RepID=UPI002C4FB5ED|nr:hypothetical protein [Dyella sp.]HUB90325.1 hypothetical protein [Dyella sp.]
MTTVFSVVDKTAQLAQRDESRQPAEDFAHELVKQAPQAKPSAQSNPKAASGQGFDEQQPFEPNPANAAPLIDDALPQTSIQAAVLQQMQAAEQLNVAPVGVTETLLEARVFGWHAMAQAYLSELTAADGSVKALSTNPIDQAAVAAQAEPMDASPATVVAVDAQAAEAAAEAQPIHAVAIPSSVAADEAPSVSALTSTLAGSGAQAIWPERSLRFTRQRDGSSVAWIRDFRLGDAEASHLVGWVLSDARQKGVPLSRIMLNGREVWASPNLNVRSTP